MNKEFRILILEDTPSEVEAVAREFRKAEIFFRLERADTKEAFREALEEFSPDIILSDHCLSQFGAIEALQLLKELNIELPFILYTASLTEELAVECMKHGAVDYVPKSKINQLPSAVLNALAKNETRTAKEKAIADLRESEYKLRTLLENMREGLVQVNNDEVIEYVNERFCELTGYDRSELLGKITYDILFDEEGWKAVSEANLQRLKGASSQNELRLKKKTGEIIWAVVSATPIIDAKGAITGSMVVLTDITERKRAEDKLLHDAFHDGLTGLANRALFMHHLQGTIARNRNQYSNLYAVLFLDFDRFKIINDSLGHAEGDKLLKYIARRLESCTRAGDLIARLGGDEFVILLTELVAPGEVMLVAERILNDLKASFDLSGREIFMTTSIGVALSTSGHTRAEDMLRDADIAMYYAKANGRAQYQIFNEEMREQASKQLQLETEMRRALERGEFSLVYQPIIKLETSELVGFEALIRWNHPERGTVLPMEFIPSAEETGLILPIGHWILNESCRQLRKWQNDNPAAALTLSVNISCKQFSQLDFAKQVASLLKSTGIEPRCLKLEVTESHIMKNSQLAVETMNRLREIGVKISLDDFGTGYSSLSCLHSLPIDYIKIDRSFVNRMVEGEENGEIVQTIIRLAQNLKMKVIAEGIETIEQLERLQQLNCEYGQGYFFSKPLDSEDANLFISATTNLSPGINSASENLTLIG